MIRTWFTHDGQPRGTGGGSVTTWSRPSVHRQEIIA